MSQFYYSLNMPNNCLTSKFVTVLLCPVVSTTLLFRIARNHGRDARVDSGILMFRRQTWQFDLQRNVWSENYT